MIRWNLASGPAPPQRVLWRYNISELSGMARALGLTNVELLAERKSNLVNAVWKAARKKFPDTESILTEPHSCLEKFTREGRPYKRSCHAANVAYYAEAKAQPEATNIGCDYHKIPPTMVTVGTQTGPVEGSGADLEKGIPSLKVLIDTQPSAEEMVVETFVPDPKRSQAQWMRNNRFVFSRDCLASGGGFSLGDLVAVDSDKSVAMQYCSEGGKDCGQALVYIELLETPEEEKAWLQRIQQYSDFDRTVLHGGYTLRVSSYWKCDSTKLNFKLPGSGSVVRGGMCGFVVVKIPEDCYFKPLRAFMLDASDPRSWTIYSAKTMCNWIRQKFSPFGLMEKRYVESRVGDLLDAMFAVGTAPNTVSAESFGVLVDKTSWKITPVLLPACDVFVNVPHIYGMAELAKMNKMIIYNSVAIGAMRNGAPSSYVPSQGLIQTVYGDFISPLFRVVVMEPMNLMTTGTSYVINKTTSAPILLGVSIRDVVVNVAQAATSAASALTPALKMTLGHVAQAGWIQIYVTNGIFYAVASRLPTAIASIVTIAQQLTQLFTFFLGANPVAIITANFAAKKTFSHAWALFSALLLYGPDPPMCPVDELHEYVTLKGKLRAWLTKYIKQNCVKSSGFCSSVKNTLSDVLMDNPDFKATCRIPTGVEWAAAIKTFFDLVIAFLQSSAGMTFASAVGLICLAMIFEYKVDLACTSDRRKRIEEAMAQREKILSSGVNSSSQ